MNRSTTEPLDTRTEAIKAMAWALRDCGYTRDSDPGEVDPKDALAASGQMLLAIVKMRDLGFACEFLTEASDDAVLSAARLLALYMMGCGDVKTEGMDAFARNARWYGEGFLAEALDLLDSADEISHDQWVDEQIDQRKAMT